VDGIPPLRFQGKNSDDGETPAGGVIIDTAGNLYGTTAYGGAGDCVLLGNDVGCGTVYELSPPTQKGGAWTETILYSFQGGKDGYLPWGDLVFDKQGNIYGATEFGGGKGTSCNSLYQYCGTVFKLTAPQQKGGKWTEKVLHSFAGIANGKQSGDGANPNGGLALGSGGVVYGTTNIGGDAQCPYSQNAGCGTAFQLTPSLKRRGQWKAQVLHRFDRSSSDGGYPSAGLLIDKKGFLYGTTLDGGPGGGGIVFRLEKKTGAWKEKILHGFNGTDGQNPESAVVFDSNGALIGTTNVSDAWYGTVFRLHPSTNNGPWVDKLVYGFQGVPDGAQPAAGIVFDKLENLYSATTQGGTGAQCGFQGCGVVYELAQ
jgi:uncharacterized repeat protein (TIGR03803 family)